MNAHVLIFKGLGLITLGTNINERREGASFGGS